MVFLDIVIAFAKWSPLGLPPGLVSIFIVSAILTLLLIFVYKWTTNQKEMEENKKRQKEIQEELKQNKDNIEKTKELSSELSTIAMKSLKLSFKPMLFTFIPVIIIFALLKEMYKVAEIGNIIYWGKNIPIVGDGGGWFFCYFVLSLVFSIIFSKIFKIH